MCGRFADHLAWEQQWTELLGEWPASVTQSFNKAPTAEVAAFTAAGGNAMRWGLVPAWSKQPTTKYATFNARVEEVSRKPAFRSAWQSERRCLIPVLGYYEWQRKESGKQPYFIHDVKGEPLFLGGLWELWSGDAERLLSCTVLTREPVASIAEIHNRMPVIVPPERLRDWLTGGLAAALEIAAEDVSQRLDDYAVSRYVNSAKNDGPVCVRKSDADRPA